MNPKLFDLEEKAREQMFAGEYLAAEVLLLRLLSMQEFLFGSRNRLVLRTLRSLLEVYAAEEKADEVHRIETRIMASEDFSQIIEFETFTRDN